MDATTTVWPDRPANDDQLGDSFFKRFTLRPGPAPLDLGDGIAKTYPLPTLYHDVGCAIGIFLAEYGAARALMPSEDPPGAHAARPRPGHLLLVRVRWCRERFGKPGFQPMALEEVWAAVQRRL